MEQNIKKQKTGFYCNNLWDVSNSTGKDICVIFCVHDQTVLNVQICKHVLGLTKEMNAILLAVYVIAMDIERYGQIDHLAPAGAMSDFCAYVKKQAEDETIRIFLPLLQYAQSIDVPTMLYTVSKGKKKKEFLKLCYEKYTTVHLL